MGPAISCRWLFVGCESVDAAVTPRQEVLRGSHGHSWFQLPFKRMSFFILGGLSVIEARKVGPLNTQSQVLKQGARLQNQGTFTRSPPAGAQTCLSSCVNMQSGHIQQEEEGVLSQD